MSRKTHLILFVAIAAALLAACAPTATPTPAALSAADQATNAQAAAILLATPTTADAAASTQPTATIASTAAGDATPTTASAASAAATLISPNAKVYQIVPDQTTAQYEVTEKFLNRALPNKAIGKTNAVSGEVQLDISSKPAGAITMHVDLSTLTSDESRRDNMIRRNWLESSTYPNADFVSTGASGLPDSYKDGDPITFKLTGNLTIHNTTKPVTFDVTGKVSGNTITGTATTQILMKDFGFNPPDIAGMLTVTDGVTVTVNFTATAK